MSQLFDLIHFSTGPLTVSLKKKPFWKENDLLLLILFPAEDVSALRSDPFLDGPTNPFLLEKENGSPKEKNILF